MPVSVVPGLYGKLPIMGDFVTRRLPASFIRSWDEWIQDALAASKEQLDSEWLQVYLTSPIWHFIVSPGNCGDTASAGILMPSVDKVGRYFPLTLAATIDDHEALPHLFLTAADWFDTLEHLALTALENDLKLDEFDQKLQAQALKLPLSATLNQRENIGIDRSIKDGAVRIKMDKLEQIPEAFHELGTCLLTRYFSNYTLWSTNGSELMKPSLLVYEGLPPTTDFSNLLTGQWQRYERGNSNVVSSSFSNPGLPKTDEVRQFHKANKGFPIRWQSCGHTTTGKVRKLNEDAFIEIPESGIWAVADGMGGHSAGDEASQLVVDALSPLSGRDTLEALSADVTDCLQKTNAELLRRAQEKNTGQIMGSTVVVMLAVENQCASIWAGDSRLYRFRSGLLSQLTRDHSEVPEKVHQDFQSSDIVAEKAHSNIVTRALGAVPTLSVDTITFDAKPGDAYLLCSDGLIKEIDPQEIVEILSRSECDESTMALINLALTRGARDNVTVITVTAECAFDTK